MAKLLFERAFEGWHLCRSIYGAAHAASVTFDKNESNIYIGVGINIDFEGSYQFRLDSLNKRLLLIEHTVNNKVIAQAAVEEELNEKIELKLENIGNSLICYLNGKAVINHQIVGESCHKVGCCGVWIHPENSAKFYDFSADVDIKKPKTVKTVRKSMGAYHLVSDFKECKNNTLPKFWFVKPGENKWNISDGKFCSPLTKNSLAEIFVFESDCAITCKLSADKTDSESNFGVVIRHAPDTAYIKIGYFFDKKKWGIIDVPALYDCETSSFFSEEFDFEENREYTIDVTASCFDISLKVDGIPVLKTDSVRHIGYGKIGLFASNCQLSASYFEANLATATPALDNAISYVITKPDTAAASMQIIETPDNKLIGVRKVLSEKQLSGEGSEEPIDPDNPDTRGLFISDNCGLSFHDIPLGGEYKGMCTDGNYQSVLKLKSGKYLQVKISQNMAVQISDDLKNWKTVSHVLENCEGAFFHTQSLCEYEMPNGKTRIFLSLVIRTPRKTNAIGVFKGHNSVVCFSDDQGYTWSRSVNGSDDFITESGQGEEALDFAESKLLMCSDGSMRMYNTRNISRFLCYSESFDYGKTWQGIHPIKYMQCAKSSFSICEDRYEKGTHYLVWVNSPASSRGNVASRIRLSLARSYDGKSWEFLGDVERMCIRYPDNLTGLRSPLFQIVDPAVTVTEKYIFITNGIVLHSSKKKKLKGSARAVHHEQRTEVIRIDKSTLTPVLWDEKTVCDLSLISERRADWL